MSKATEEALGELHGAIAKKLKERIESGEVTAAELSVARQFLKDNYIQADAGKNEGLQGLADALPEFDDGDNVTPLYGG